MPSNPVLHFPYGRGKIALEIPRERLAAVLEPRPTAPYRGVRAGERVEHALAHPIESPRLCELARTSKRVVILSSDHTRPVPSRVLMPMLLREIRLGNPNAEITILIATGCHRAPTRAEMLERYGRDILENEAIRVHDCDDGGMLTEMGMLSSGNRMLLNRVAAQADLLIGEGCIEPHFFAGYSGGCKSVLPGVCGRETILYNHGAANIRSACARAGNLLRNPVHDDMREAARRANLRFILNVVLDANKEILGVFAGDPDAAHLAGTDFLRDICLVRPVKSDIVISTNGGFPLDQNLYQSVKGLSAAAATCKERGTIIMLSRCNDGHGGRAFFDMLRSAGDFAALYEELCGRENGKTTPDQWQAQIFLSALRGKRVLFVSDAPREMVEALHMEWMPNLDAAYKSAIDAMGSGAMVTALPDSVAVVVADEDRKPEFP